MRCYASLVELYTVDKLKRMTARRSICTCCAVVHDRCQRLNDNLLGAFCSLVRRYV